MTTKISRALFWFLCLSIALVCYRILFTGMEAGFPNMRNHFGHALIFWTHVVAASTALMLTPFQFWKGLRDRRRTVHRWIGRTYVVAVLAGGLSGLYMSFFTMTGPAAGAGFFLLAVGWLATTLMAYVSIRKGDVPAHQLWMIRSAALVFAAVTLRIYLPLSMVAGLPFEPSYTVIAWACWIPNLIAVELWRRRKGRTAPAVMVQAG